MTWTDYVAQVPGANGLFIKLQLRNDEPNIVGNSTVVHYKAIIYNTSTAQWWNQLSETPMRLSINGADILNVQNGNYDVRGQGRSQTIREGSVTVAHNSDGTKQMAFLWHFDPRTTWHSISGPAVVQGNYALPNILRASKPTLSKNNFYFGETVTVNMNRQHNSFTHVVTYEINGVSRVINNVAYTNATFSVPFSDVPTNADSVAIQVKVVTKHGNTVLGTEVINATVSLHPDVKPSIGSILIQDTVQAVMNVFNSGSDFIRGVSKLRVSAMGITTRYNSPIAEYLYRVKGKNDVNVRSAQSSQVLAPFQFPQQGIETIRLQMAVVDSRGRQSAWVDSREIRIHFYAAPRLGTMLPTRTGGGTIVTVKRNWSVSSLVQNGATTEKNTASLKFYTRQTGASQWTENSGARSTSLNGVDSLANLSGTFAGNQTYEIKAVLSDRFGTVESAPIPVGTESVTATFYKDKTALGGVVDKNGSTLQVHGDIDVKKGGRLLFGGVALPTLINLDGTVKEAKGDWNNYTETGFYWGRNLANRPAGTHEWRYVEVYRYDADGRWVIQKMIDFNGRVTAQRVRDTGVWKPWNYVLTTETMPDILKAFNDENKFIEYRWGAQFDMNTIKKSGLYFVGSGRNCPCRGLMLVSRVSGNETVQVIFDVDSNKIYRRISNWQNGVWGAWTS
ncbi:DUF859 family phage minor structural protein [Aerococcaceae bacterium NML191219]|nr:DUF859 family phage minor structural protein [Aerococcaceae bacterium NML191219]